MLTAGEKFVLKMGGQALPCGRSPQHAFFKHQILGPAGEARKPTTLDDLKRIQARRDRRMS